ENQYVASPAPQPQPAAVATQGTANETESEQVDPSQVKLPPGAPPLGFFGYCCVTMKENNDWQPGSVEWGAIHRGRTYLFRSQELRDKFLANPDSYAPVLAGADPVL